ncbi:hypothetical protein O181_011528 [Austropuccinia psidii MF-1]|uniref:Secreted protein n=1 Tax=Austropuccinia psidii MF-1 TaxID=1389203 RepID=A0A9Q3BV14_9BASI|nr:hypothetical protein [Austropuccinia psidii MF-1]
MPKFCHLTVFIIASFFLRVWGIPGVSHQTCGISCGGFQDTDQFLCSNYGNYEYLCKKDSCKVDYKPLETNFYFTDCHNEGGGPSPPRYIWPIDFEVRQNENKIAVTRGKKSESLTSRKMDFETADLIHCPLGSNHKRPRCESCTFWKKPQK